ncbi:hypothetical protein BDW68DRAFT_4714 [Aspergillus falconensis]
MRTRLARTAVKSVIASTTVLNSVTLLPILSVACVAMLDTWLVIVLTVREAAIGATVGVSTPAVGPSGVVMLSTERWRYVHSHTLKESILTSSSNLCKNCLAVRPVRMANQSVGSRPVLTVMTTAITSPGNALPHQATWLPGSNGEAATTAVTTMDPATMAVPHHGPLRAVAATTTVTVPALMALHLELGQPLPGNRHLPLHLDRLLMDMAIPHILHLHLVWALLLLLLAWVLLRPHLACPRCTMAPVAVHLRLLLVRDHPLRLRATSPRLLPPRERTMTTLCW